jgi:hypothetical protein
LPATARGAAQWPHTAARVLELAVMQLDLADEVGDGAPGDADAWVHAASVTAAAQALMVDVIEGLAAVPSAMADALVQLLLASFDGAAGAIAAGTGGPIAPTSTVFERLREDAGRAAARTWADGPVLDPSAS